MVTARKHVETAKSNEEQVELQDLGHGHWRAVCGERSFRTDERDGDLWVDHRELARFFGYVGKSGPTNLKALIETCKKDGLIEPGETVLETNTNKNWDDIEHIAIKRNAALALAMRCTLPNAVRLARKMADVFEQWLDRRHHDSGIDQATLSNLANSIVKLTAVVSQHGELLQQIVTRLVSIESDHSKLCTKVADLDQRFRMDVGTISVEYVDEHIKKPLSQIAFLRNAADPSRSVKSHRKGADNELRNVVCHNGKGSAWTNYPRDARLLQILENFVQTLLDGAINAATADVRKKAAEKAKREVESRLKQLQLLPN